MENLYRNPRIRHRKYGEWKQKLLPPFTFGDAFGNLHQNAEGEQVKIGKYKVVGYFRKRRLEGPGYESAEAIEVTLNNGTLIAAYRLSDKHAICTNLTYIVSKP